MMHQSVGMAEASDPLGRKLMCNGVFENGAAEPVLQRMIFHCQHCMICAQDAREHLAIDWLTESRVDDGNFNSFACQSLARRQRNLRQRAVSDNCRVVSFAQNP